MKLSTKSSCRHTKECAVALSMLSEHAKYADSTEKVVHLVNNYHNGVCTQKRDANEDADNKEEVILNSFLVVADRKALSLIETLA